jgi:hypothetical protein
VGNQLGVQDGYPAGVSNADPHFHAPDPDDTPCGICGHEYQSHADGGGECELCECDGYDLVPW